MDVSVGIAVAGANVASVVGVSGTREGIVEGIGVRVATYGGRVRRPSSASRPVLSTIAIRAPSRLV